MDMLKENPSKYQASNGLFGLKLSALRELQGWLGMLLLVSLLVVSFNLPLVINVLVIGAPLTALLVVMVSAHRLDQNK